MIIPYGHEHTTVRRLPWVTFALMGLCVVVFVLTSVTNRDSQSHAAEDLNEFFEYLIAHPYLEVDPEFEQLLFRFVPEQEFRAFREASRDLGAQPPSHPRQVELEQQELDRIVSRIKAAIDGVKEGAYFRFGLVPADLQLHAFITHQFLHGGFLHLFGNLFFLFLAGPFIEDVWGRPLFAAFYLTAGVVAGLMFAVRYPELDSPLIGASGAIAGVMGAFLIRYWKTKIKFMYFFFPFRPGTFTAPAWLMLPLWFGRELIFAQAFDVISPGSGGSGVAHWAHVWGFAFGLAVAGALVYWKVEDRFIHRAIESKITVFDNSVVEEAMQARSEGKLERAVELLSGAVDRQPDNIDAVIALWTAELAAGRPERAAPHLLRVLNAAARRDDDALILAHWEELIAAIPEIHAEPAIAARIAEILLRDGRHEAAAATVDMAAGEVGTNTAIGPLLRLVRAADAVGAASTAELATEALGRQELPPELHEELSAIVANAPDRSPPDEADSGAAEPGETLDVAVVQHGLQVMEAVPLSLEGTTLVISVNGTSRRMSLRQVQAVAVAGVTREGKRPVVVVDLMLDPPWSDREHLRVVRLSSTCFDPRAIAGGSDPQDSFRALLAQILDASGAAPLPDPDSARGRPFRTYASLQDYQERVLGVT